MIIIRCSGLNGFYRATSRRFASMTSELPKIVHDFQDMPSPKGLPFLGTALSLMAAGSGSRIHKYIDGRHKELGSIFRDAIGPVKAVFTSDPEAMRTVFTKVEGKYPVHLLPEPWTMYNQDHNCKRGLIFMDGEEWLDTRRVMNKLLLKLNSEEWIDGPISLVADNLVECWKKKASPGFQPNLDSDLYRLSLDVILSVMLGSAYKSEAHKFNGLLNKFSDSVYGISKNTSNMTMLPANLYKKFKFPAWSGFEEAMTQSLAYGEKMVNEIYSLEDIGDGLASRMIAEGMDKEMVTRILIDFIIAAGDTTTYTTQWALYLLSKNPKIMKEFQSAEESSEEQIYLKGIIKETMRLYPAAAFLTRLLPADSIVANYNLPAGTLIVMSLYTTGREEKYYPDPLKFDPQRWMKQNNEYNGVITPHASIPFAIGARSCIGRKIAMVQLNKTISKILRNFNLQTLHKHDVDDVMQMILKPKESIRILVTQR